MKGLFGLGIAGVVIGLVVNLALLGAVVWVAFHFISKFW